LMRCFLPIVGAPRGSLPFGFWAVMKQRKVSAFLRPNQIDNFLLPIPGVPSMFMPQPGVPCQDFHQNQ
jgi:hypothetical protein